MDNNSTTVDSQNAADVNKGKPPVELHGQSDAKYAAYHCDTMSAASNGSEIETSERSYKPSESEKLRESYEEEEKEEEEEEEEEKEKEEEEEDAELDKEDKEAEEEEKEEDEEEDDDKDIQDVCEKDEEEGFSPLYLALQSGDTETVRRLLTSSVDVNMLDANKTTRSELYAIVKRLLNKNASVDPSNAFGQTSLHMASENDHLGIAHVPVKGNADTNICSDSDNDPLLVAAEMDYAEIVKALIDYDGEINAVDENGETVLHLAARNDLNAVVDVLLNHSAERDVRTRLKHAVNQVLSTELELSQNPIRKNIYVGQMPHHIATQGGSFELVEDILSFKAVSTGQVKPIHAHLTAGYGYKEIVENLILKGANVNACNKAKMTPLHLACQNGLSSIVEILLDNHATVDVTKQAQKTPFYLAAENGHANVVDVLLRRGICDFVTINWNDTPLHVAVNKSHTKVVEVILKYSCRSNDKLTKDEQKVQENAKNLVETSSIISAELMNLDGRRFSAEIVWTEKSTPIELMLGSDRCTALELAVESIQPKMVEMLLSVHPCVYSEMHLGNSFWLMTRKILFSGRAYGLVSWRKRRNITDSMEGLSYDIQYKMKYRKIKEIARVLMNSSKFNVNYQDVQLNTPLHEVIKQCEECFYDYPTKKSRPQLLRIQIIDDIIQLLFERGADLNTKNAFGETPLIIASKRGCSHVIQILFDWEKKTGLKLDLDARNQNGATALIKAAETHHVSVMRLLLLNHKVSVNLQDYYGFTALHAAVYGPNRNWFDMHFFCKGLLRRKFDNLDECLKISRWGKTKWGEETLDPHVANHRLKEKIEHDDKTTRFKEEMVKLLLAIDELNVNAIDFRGNTPLDLAVKSSKRITSETFTALENRGAIQNTLEAKDEAPIEVARVDERGRNPLHRLIISLISYYAVEDTKAAKMYHERLNLMVDGILLKRENFRRSATATDDKGRTPLHYAVMPPYYFNERARVLVRVLLEIGSNVNAADMYGKTPLHYAEMNDQYELLVHHGADESTQDKNGHTPRDLRQLRDSATINSDNAKKFLIKKKALYVSNDIACVLNTNHVTELSKRRLYETLRIYSQSPRPEESSEEAIWKIWIENEFFSLNRRVNQLKPSILSLIKRLADGIKEKDWRFECQPLLVGSADEGTKAVISADFDFNFKLIKFSRLCDVFPHSLGPKGYFQLRRTRDNTERRQSDEEFDCFFNFDECLLTDEVNSRFQIVLEEVLRDPNFWQDEHLFEWDLADTDEKKLRSSEKTAGLCKTVRLRMINPIADRKGGLLFVNVSIDVVACVHKEDTVLGDQLPVFIRSAGKADGCTLVFDRPRFDPSKKIDAHYIFSDTFARISFAPLESRIIRESSSLIKAAYMVCKLILYNHPKTTYQLKTSLLFCMEALRGIMGCERKDEVEITQKELAFWVERIMFCFMQFYQHDVYPSYFMPSFRRQVVQVRAVHWDGEADKEYFSFMSKIPFHYSAASDIYLDLCPDDTSIDIPIIGKKYTDGTTERSLDANQDPKWEQFDREEFIGKLSSRSFSY